MKKLLVPLIAAAAFAATLVTPAAAANDTIWIGFSGRSINHWQELNRKYYCPGGYVVGDTSNPLAIPFTNASSANVSASLSGGGYGTTSINVDFVNWNWWGDQTVSINLACHPLNIPGAH